MKAETPGAQIRRARQEAGLTQAELAQKLRVHKVTVGDWERNRFFPDRHWAALNKVLGISLRPPGAQPEPEAEKDVIAEELGEETAERLRRVLRERGEAGRIVLDEIERAFRPPASDPPGPEQSRAAG